jgi:hypothetical protein
MFRQAPGLEQRRANGGETIRRAARSWSLEDRRRIGAFAHERRSVMPVSSAPGVRLQLPGGQQPRKKFVNRVSRNGKYFA